MEHEDIGAQQKFIFAGIFLLANKLQLIGDKLLDDVTTKQWFLTVAIAQFGAVSPTLSEVAEVMGSSHQNVKQIALKLAEKGFLRIDKDQHDNRAIRLTLTAKSNAYWQNRQDEDDRFIAGLFSDLTTAEINSMYQGMTKIHRKVLEIISKS